MNAMPPQRAERDVSSLPAHCAPGTRDRSPFRPRGARRLAVSLATACVALVVPGVAHAQATLVASPSSLSFTGTSISAVQAQNVTITNAGTQPTDYTGGLT